MSSLSIDDQRKLVDVTIDEMLVARASPEWFKPNDPESLPQSSSEYADASIRNNNTLVIHFDPVAKQLNVDEPSNDILSIVCVSPRDPNSSQMTNIRKLVKLINRNNVPVEFHTWEVLMRRIPFHIFQPIGWKKITCEEFEKNNQGLIAANLPKMLTSDPISKYFAFKGGDLVQIVRASTPGGEGVSYRYVVDAV